MTDYEFFGGRLRKSGKRLFLGNYLLVTYLITYQIASFSELFVTPRPSIEVYDTIWDSSTREDRSYLGFVCVVAV